jgi:hypothetical protein
LGLIDKLKDAGEQASSRARGTVQEVQLRRDLAEAYGELGRKAYALVREGALTDARLLAPIERVRELEGQLASSTGADIR